MGFGKSNQATKVYRRSRAKVLEGLKTAFHRGIRGPIYTRISTTILQVPPLMLSNPYFIEPWFSTRSVCGAELWSRERNLSFTQWELSQRSTKWNPIPVQYPPSASSAGLPVDTDKCEVTNHYFEYFWRWRVHVSSILTSRLQRRIIILLHLYSLYYDR